MHVSTAGSVDIIRHAKQQGDKMTEKAAPQHFTLTDRRLRTFDSNYKMSPPLRSEADVQVILTGLKDGTLEVIATDHAPHAPFFFSSRRRHTRCLSDWSSDVCSSD